jgi:hypothetical protein
MADTGAPWSIPYAEPSSLVRDWPELSEDVADAVAAGLSAAAFNARTVITATDASWPVPTLANPVVRVTVIGGGGGGAGGGAVSGTTAGGAGGTTTFAASTGTLTAAGGAGGPLAASSYAGVVGTGGFACGNGGGGGGGVASSSNFSDGDPGRGGVISVGYLDLTGVSTVNVTIGAGGSGGSGGGAGGAGGRGEVIVEYVAG